MDEIANAETSAAGKMPDVVYHYTSMDTLKKIVQKKELWATNVKYLNDVTEHEFFVKATVGRLGHIVMMDADFDWDAFLRRYALKKTHPDPFYNLPFVASFAAKDDSLTHWRSYCSKGNGVCIGFRIASLTSATTLTPSQAGVLPVRPVFGKVQYLSPNDFAHIEMALLTAYSKAKANVDRHRSRDLAATLIDELRYEIENVAAFYKHDSFADEREYRLTVDGIHWRRDLLDYRPTASTLVPYVAINIPSAKVPEDLSDGKLWTAIASVRIGPTPNKELSVDAVHAMLESCGLTCYRVDATDVPYRDW